MIDLILSYFPIVSFILLMFFIFYILVKLINIEIENNANSKKIDIIINRQVNSIEKIENSFYTLEKIMNSEEKKLLILKEQLEQLDTVIKKLKEVDDKNAMRLVTVVEFVEEKYNELYQEIDKRLEKERKLNNNTNKIVNILNRKLSN